MRKFVLLREFHQHRLLVFMADLSPLRRDRFAGGVVQARPDADVLTSAYMAAGMTSRARRPRLPGFAR